MLGRISILGIAGALAALPAAADPAAICGGKYANAAEIVGAAFAKYGTLYSGGGHWGQRDNVGATVDFYRLMRGYPDIKLRTRIENPSWNDELNGVKVEDNDNGDPQKTWSRASWALRSDAPIDADPVMRFWAGWGLDVLTSAGPEADWWLRERPPTTPGQDQLGFFAVGQPGPAEEWIATKFRSEPGLEWLQYILAASNAPWANNWLASSDQSPEVARAHTRLMLTAFNRYKAGEGAEWLIAAVLNDPGSYNDLRVALGDLAGEIKACRATPQQYAMWASTLPSLGHDRYPLMNSNPSWIEIAPPQVHRVVAILALQKMMGARWADVRRNPTETITQLRALAPNNDYEWQTSIDLMQLYHAKDVSEIPVSAMQKVRRAYNLLSADDLATLAGKAGPTSDLARVAFARHVALGNVAKARALIPALKAASPDAAATIDRLWKGNEPEQVRLALIVLHTPGLTSLVRFDDGDDYGLNLNARYVALRRNLPPEYRSAGILQRDFEVQLRLPQAATAYRTPRGMSIRWMQRQGNRGIHNRHLRSISVPKLIANGPGESVPFAKLIAWEELVRLTGEDRLMHAVGRVVLPWADQQIRSGANKSQVSEALARLVYLCRYSSCGESGGLPAQQQAFRMLKNRLPDTDGARRTTSWWTTFNDG